MSPHWAALAIDSSAELAIACRPHADPSSTDVGDRLGGGGHRTVSQTARRVDRLEVTPNRCRSANKQ